MSGIRIWEAPDPIFEHPNGCVSYATAEERKRETIGFRDFVSDGEANGCTRRDDYLIKRPKFVFGYGLGDDTNVLTYFGYLYVRKSWSPYYLTISYVLGISCTLYHGGYSEGRCYSYRANLSFPRKTPNFTRILI